jgi:hypothetical protein
MTKKVTVSVVDDFDRAVSVLKVRDGWLDAL